MCWHGRKYDWLSKNNDGCFRQDDYLILINPVILKTSNKTYIAEEGCLSLQGVRKTQRYESIKVSYLDINFKKKIKTFKGYTAQIIQHELDHFEGKII